jgi:hypothetical protein
MALAKFIGKTYLAEIARKTPPKIGNFQFIIGAAAVL